MNKTEFYDSWPDLIEALAHGVIITNDEGVILFANKYAAKLFNRTPIQLLNTTFSYPLAAGEKQEIEILQTNGQVITAQMTVKKGAWHNHYAWVISVQNITKFKLNKMQLELTSTAFNSAFEGIIIMDETQKILQANQAFLDITAYRLEELIGKRPKEVVQLGDQSKKFYHKLWEELNKTGHGEGEILIKGKNSELTPIFLSISSIKNIDGDLINYVGFFSELREEKNQATEIERLKNYDFLTGLPNIPTLLKKVDLYIKNLSANKSFYILNIRISDLDKAYTNADKILYISDDMIFEGVRRIDKASKHKKLFARTGLSEFTLVYFSNKSVTSLLGIAHAIVDALSHPCLQNNKRYALDCNIGIARYEQKYAISAESFLQQAQSACLSAKQLGKNKVVFYDNKAAKITIAFHQHIDAIRHAIKHNQLQLYYQPKVDILQGKILGFEALLRWQHPEKGLLLPAQFLLNQLDNQPISLEIGDWVQVEVLRQAERLLKENSPIPLSINISAYQLQHQDFVSHLISTLSRFPNVPSTMIMFEILETASLEDMSLIIDVMQKCLPLGIKFSLDDYGTGYSALSYIRQLNLYEIKLDQSFIRDCIYRTEDMIILKSTIDLCNMLGRKLTAEGVETDIHAKMLLSLGCPRMQGYAIAKPMPGASVITWLKTWKPNPSWKQRRISMVELESLIRQDIQHFINFNSIHLYLNDKNAPLIDFNYSSCKYGQWLTDHPHIFKNTQAMKQFDKIHKLIHKQAIEIIELANNGRGGQANSVLSKLIKSRRDFIYQLIKSVYED